MSVIHLVGASLIDTCFELDIPGIPQIIWNVSKLAASANVGEFGPPITMRIDDLPPMDLVNWTNLDQDKVHAIVAKASNIVAHPDWECCGKATKPLQLIDTPTIGVIFEHGGRHHCVPVDGNHRLAARTLMGLTHFQRFEVPPELERGYRVTIREF